MSDKSVTKLEKQYYKSLHYKAKARMNHMQGNQLYKELNNLDDNTLSGTYKLLKITVLVIIKSIKGTIYDKIAHRSFNG